MKKIKLCLFACIAFLCLVSKMPEASAKNGDVIGKIYSTDILAKIGEKNAPSYNIGGRTAVVIEELCDNEYGLNYDVTAEYDDDERTLIADISPNFNFTGGDYGKIKRGKVGKILGDIYATDITVYVNGFEVNGYNIGGKTAVVIEDLGLIDGYNSEYGYSKYRLKANWDSENRIISLNGINKSEFSPFGYSAYSYANFIKYTINGNVITVQFDRMTRADGECKKIDITEDQVNGKLNILQPLYLDNGTQKQEVGFMYYELLYYDADDKPVYESHLYITDNNLFEQTLEGLYDGKKPTPEEAFAALDDNVKYKTLEKLETEDFYVLAVKHLDVDDEEEPSSAVISHIGEENKFDRISFVLVGKNGGYGKIYGKGSSYEEWRMEKTGENVVDILYGPMAAPGGTLALIRCAFNLNNYFVK